MDTSQTVATWLSFAVTAVGLGGLISQANAINDKMDPFHAHRNVEYLGIWFRRQRQFPWYVFRKPPPVGANIKANMSEGFCGLHTVHVTRVPHGRKAMAGWSTLLSLVHVHAPLQRRGSVIVGGEVELEKAYAGVGSTTTTFYGEVSTKFEVDGSEWDFLSQMPLVKYKNDACTLISRTTLIVLLCLTNARRQYSHSGAAGYRAGFGSYPGQWYITWPIGEEAMVRLAPHDSHNAKTDVYPPIYVQRVDKCIQILAGVVSSLSGLNVAFCGRKAPGAYRLEHVAKGFPGAHGSRHLYNMMGGKVYEVDFMFAHKATAADVNSPEDLVLQLPSTDNNGSVMMTVFPKEEEIIRQALDCLPWTSLSWSIHRGLRDILVTYARPVMDARRQELADRLKQTVVESPHLLDRRGWNAAFVRSSMADMAASAVLARSGNSGDLVRVVTDIVMVLVSDWKLSQLDEVNFWRRQQPNSESKLDLRGIIALTKVFVLEWSPEFDYQMYHDIPMTLYFG